MLKTDRSRRIAVVLPFFVAAAVLPVVTPASKPGVRQWTLPSTATAQKAPGEFGLVGVKVPGEPGAEGSVRLRTSADGRSWSKWSAVAFEDDGPDPNTDEPAARGSVPIWTGTQRYVQVSGAPRGSEIHVVDPGPDPVAPRASAMASPSKPGIITRAGWGADESIRRGTPSYAASLQLAVVHHTATTNSYAKSESDNIIRSIYAYHVKTNGWDDIGYNFLIDRYGQIFEGRYGGIDRNVIGAHSMGFNTGSTGISMLGTFASAKPPEIAMSSLKRILSWRLDQGTVDPTTSVTYVSNGSNKYPEGQRVTLKRVIGHRDVGETTCPGLPVQETLTYVRNAALRDGLPKLFDAKVSRAAITPNSDGIADALKLTGRFSSAMNWKTEVLDAAGKSLYALSGSGATLSVNWYGKDSSGAAVPHGSYRFKVTGKGTAGALRTYYVPFSVYRWPNGTFMYTTKKVTYILSKGVLRHPSNYQARSTHYRSDEYVVVPDTVTKYYPKSMWIGFREGAMVSADGTVYLISEGRKRPTTKSALAAKGFDTSGIIATTAEALSPHPTGSNFTSGSAIPNGAAVRASSGTEGWMMSGIARHFFNTKVRQSYMIRDVDFAQPADELLAAGAFSDPLGFRDGTLVRVADETTIYMISDGKRRPFRSSTVFKRMGFSSGNIRSVTPAELALHPEGKRL